MKVDVSVYTPVWTNWVKIHLRINIFTGKLGMTTVGQCENRL